MSDSWRKTVTIDDREVEIEFTQRPFREGLEVTVYLGDEALHFGELGFGEGAVIERIRELLKERK